jgi:hypothetical protein
VHACSETSVFTKRTLAEPAVYVGYTHTHTPTCQSTTAHAHTHAHTRTAFIFFRTDKKGLPDPAKVLADKKGLPDPATVLTDKGRLVNKIQQT